MSPSCNKGFTLVELMVAMAVGALLVLAAMILYVPVSRALVDQGVVGQQTLSEAVNYDFDVMNTANAG
ncbi:prepilin-type N-terminal cleavage/methylation domain-containing protein, partial [Acidiferrobacter sp.]